MDEERYRRAEQAIWRSAGVQPTERVLPLERTGAQVRVQEVGSGQPVVLVHGAMNAGTSWASLVARLEGFRCIMIDRPGCGLSPRLASPPVTMENLGVLADSLIVDVLDALDIEQSHLIGTSFGGYFALRTAAAHPRRITRLVPLSWSFGAPTVATPLVMRVAMVPVVGRLMLRIRPNERMVRSMLKQIGLRAAVESGRFGPVEIAWYLSLLRDTDTMQNESDGTPPVATWRGFNDATLLPAAFLGSVSVPTYVLWGDDDPMGGRAIAEPFVAQIPGAQLDMMPGAGHAPWMDDPDFVAERVRAFLGG